MLAVRGPLPELCAARSPPGAVRGPLPVVTRSTAFNYKRADWDGLRAVLRLVSWNVLDGLPVNDATALLYNLVKPPSATTSRWCICVNVSRPGSTGISGRL